MRSESRIANDRKPLKSPIGLSLMRFEALVPYPSEVWGKSGKFALAAAVGK